VDGDAGAEVGEEDDGAEGDAGEGHEEGVAVGDVAEFVGDDALEFVAAESFEEAGGDGDAGAFGFEADSKGVGDGCVYDVYAGHRGEGGGDAHFFDDVVELRGVGVRDFAGVGGGEEDGFAARHADEEHDAPDADADEYAGDGGAGVAGHEHAEGAAESGEDEGEDKDEPRGAPLVGGNGFPHDGAHSLEVRGQSSEVRVWGSVFWGGC